MYSSYNFIRVVLTRLGGVSAVALTITLQPEFEKQFREEAASAGLTAEQLATQRLVEAELLWRIRTAAPDTDTRRLHRLLRRNRAGTISESERISLLSLLDERENRAARRIEDLTQLSSLRSIPVSEIMEQLGIRPVVSR